MTWTAKPSILILHAPGTNRDRDAAWACEVAGGAPEIVHINQLRSGVRHFQAYDMLLLPGGFSYGDALGAGVRQALDLYAFFQEELHHFVESGKKVLGICNGFQTLVKAGLLPGAADLVGQKDEIHRTPLSVGSHIAYQQQRADLGTEAVARQVTLTDNASGQFECRWVYLATESTAMAGYVAGISDLIFCPVAHGEGNFQVANEATLRHLEQNGLIALRYVDSDGNPAAGRYPINPNGSVSDIAGICNQAGNVLGLMPHPEDHILPIQNPLGSTGQLGLALFQAVLHA